MFSVETEFATCFMRVSCLVYSSTLKMEVSYSCEKSDGFQRTTWCYIPEDRTLHVKRNIYFSLLDPALDKCRRQSHPKQSALISMKPGASKASFISITPHEIHVLCPRGRGQSIGRRVLRWTVKTVRNRLALGNDS
jgi:hypothetical protein